MPGNGRWDLTGGFKGLKDLQFINIQQNELQYLGRILFIVFLPTCFELEEGCKSGRSW